MAPCAPTAADAAALRAKCEVGASFAMLLQLKGFLKDVYQLSDKKCGEYAPADTSRTTEKAIAPGLKVPEFALGAATRALVDASAGGAAPPLEAQRDLFVELRALMHDDAAGLLTTGLAPERKGAKGAGATPRGAAAKGKGAAAKGKGGKGAKGKGGAATVKKRKRRKIVASDDEAEEEDDDDDEDWA